jgi:hypothetical protein
MAENEWTDELKQQVIEAYESREPTPENTVDICKEVAEEFEKTPNGVRLVLSRAGVYVKKNVPQSSDSGASGGSKRVNKQQAIDDLKKKIKDLGQDVDNDICDRLTGKAAVYIKGVLDAVG